MTPNLLRNARRFRWIGQMPAKFFFKPLVLALAELMLLMLGLADMPVIGPAIAPRAHADDITVKPTCHPTQGQGQIIQNVCSYINPPQSLNPFVNATPPFADIQQLESDAVQEFLAMYGLPATDAGLIYQYGRTDLRNMIRSHIMANLLHIASYGWQNDHEKALYVWLATQIQQYEIAYYTVAIQERNRWESNPCSWTPDPDIAQQYGLVYDGSKFCNSNNSLAAVFQIAPSVPSAAYFRAFALKQVYGASLGSQGTLIQGATMADFGEIAGIAGAAALAGAAATPSVIAIPSVTAFLFPYLAVEEAELGVLALAGPAEIVMFFILIGIVATWEVFNNQATVKELAGFDQDLSDVKSQLAPLSIFAGDPEPPGWKSDADPTGMYKIMSVITALMMPEFPSSATLPAHQLSDINFYLTPSNTYTTALNYTDAAGAVWTAQTYNGWFVRHCLQNCPATAPTDSFVPTIDAVDSSGTAWYASRMGSSFALTRKKPVDGLNACPASQGTPNPQNCSSYVTQTAPYKNGGGVFGTFTLVTNPIFTSGASASFTQGVPGTFTITASGLPLPTISSLFSIPTGFSLNTSTPGQATLSYDGSAISAGTYGLTLSAQNGTSATQTLTIHLNEATPQFTSPSTANFVKGVPGSFTIQVTGNPPPAITTGTPHFPPIDLNLVDNGNGTATISGAIPVNANYCAGSSCNITGFINATNSAGVGGSSAQQTLTLSVTSAVLPALLPPTSFNFIAGAQNTAVIQATGPTLGQISNVCNTLPGWLTVTDNGNNTATLSGVPPLSPSSVGLHIIVSPPGAPPDFNCGSISGSNYTVNVTLQPAFTSPSTGTFTAGTAGSFTVTGVPSSLITMTEGTLPQGLAFSPDFENANITGTPAAGTGGLYPIQFAIQSGATTAYQNFTLVVDEQPSFPGPYSTTFTVNQPSSFPIATYGYPHTPTTDHQGMQISVIPGIFGPLPPGINLVQTTNGFGTGTGEWLLTGTPTVLGQYTFELTLRNDVGNVVGQAFTINVVPVAPPKTNPVLTWTAPAAITYGSALSAVQLNAAANVPGSFTYAPPAGTVLPVGTQTLSTTFTPTDMTTYNTATASTTIVVNPAPPAASGPNLVVTKTLNRVNGNITVLIRISNTGGTAATGVTLTTLKIGSTSGSPLPQNLGIIDPGASAEATVTVPGSAGAAGTANSLTLAGTYVGGTYSSNSRITLP